MTLIIYLVTYKINIQILAIDKKNNTHLVKLSFMLLLEKLIKNSILLF